MKKIAVSILAVMLIAPMMVGTSVGAPAAAGGEETLFLELDLSGFPPPRE
jgi:hypothetical protein